MKVNHGGDPADTNRALSSWPIFIALGGTGSLFLSRLRGVRRFGKGKLGFLESIETALEQGKAYKRWCVNPTPVRRVQVWAESRPVMTVAPDDELSNLKSFRFEVKSPQNAVIQIVKADEGEQPIVLRNVPLNIIESCGLDQTKELPNGQKIRLVIIPEEEGRYDIMVAFAPEEDGVGLAAVRQPRAARAKANAGGNVDVSVSQRGFLRMPLRQSLLYAGGCACAVVLIAVATFKIISAFTASTVRSGHPVTAKQADMRPAVPIGDAPASSPAPEKPIEPATDAGHRQEPNVVEARGSKSACPVSSKHGATKEAPTANSNSDKINTPPPSVPPETKYEARPTIVLGLNEPGPTLRAFSSWDEKNLPKLAKIRSVRVRMDQSSAALVELDLLHNSFINAWNESTSRLLAWELKEGETDAVLNLKFDPDETCLGVLRINVDDAEGNFLFQAYIRCQDLKKQGHEAMFIDASKRLLERLEYVVRSSQTTAKQQPTIGPENITLAVHKAP